MAHTLPALTRLSLELFEDMSPSALDRITNALIQACSLELDRAGLRGSGTAPEPQGVRFQEKASNCARWARTARN